MHAIGRAWLNKHHGRRIGRAQVRSEAGEVFYVCCRVRICKKLKRILLRNIQTAIAKVFLIPRPVQPLACKLVADMLKSVAGTGRHLCVTRRKERLKRGRCAVVISRYKIKLITWGIAHYGWKDVVRQSKLLGPVP